MKLCSFLSVSLPSIPIDLYLSEVSMCPRLANVSKNFKISLEGHNYVHFDVILSRNVKIFGIMASL